MRLAPDYGRNMVACKAMFIGGALPPAMMGGTFQSQWYFSRIPPPPGPVADSGSNLGQ